MRICVVIPAHNEAKTIGSLVEYIRRKNLDVVVVDDGSQDSCADIAYRAGAKVFKNDQKKGKGASLRRGFDAALSEGYDAIIMMDGDGQHSPDDIDAFCAALREHAFVIGNRFADPQGMPLARLWTNRFMSVLLSLFCRQQIMDSQCGFRAIRSSLLRSMRLYSDNFEIESEMLIRAARQKVAIRSVPVRTIYGAEISKINPLKDTMRFFSFCIREMFRHE